MYCHGPPQGGHYVLQAHTQASDNLYQTMARLEDGAALELSDVPVPTLAWAVVAVAAGLNLAVGVALALRQPARASDLLEIYDWCRSWLFGRHDLYAGPYAVTDYPPNAIVMLSPLALLPQR